MRELDGPCLFSLDAESGTGVASALDLALAEHEERQFEDGEHKIRPLGSVRERDVYLLCSLYGDSVLSANDRLVRTLFFLGALRNAGARRLTAVLPYLCYSRKDSRTKPRDPVSTRYVAAVLEAIGIDRVLSVDVHNPAAYENAFRIPADYLRPGPLFARHLAARLRDEEVAVISPDAGGIKRAEAFRETLERQLGRSVQRGFMEKHRSGGVVSGERLMADVAGRDVVLVDDLVSSGRTLARAATACRERGARRILAAATHAVFSTEAAEVLGDAPLDALLVTDTVPVPRPGRAAPRDDIEVIEIAPLLAESIRRLHSGGSLTELTDDG